MAIKILLPIWIPEDFVKCCLLYPSPDSFKLTNQGLIRSHLLLPCDALCPAKKDSIYVQMTFSLKTSISVSFTQPKLEGEKIYPLAITIIFGDFFTLSLSWHSSPTKP